MRNIFELYPNALPMTMICLLELLDFFWRGRIGDVHGSNLNSGGHYIQDFNHGVLLGQVFHFTDIGVSFFFEIIELAAGALVATNRF